MSPAQREGPATAKRAEGLELIRSTIERLEAGDFEYRHGVGFGFTSSQVEAGDLRDEADDALEKACGCTTGLLCLAQTGGETTVPVDMPDGYYGACEAIAEHLDLTVDPLTRARSASREDLVEHAVIIWNDSDRERTQDQLLDVLRAVVA